MPRSAWLAVGGVIAALALTLGDERIPSLVLVVSAMSLLAALWLPRAAGRIAGVVAIGVLIMTLRSVVLQSPPGLAGEPDGEGPWRMVVETVGSPRDGDQVATLRTPDGPTTGFRVAATLPRYPTVEPGDRIEVGGRVRPRPDSPYGQYLARLDAWGTLDARTLRLEDRPTDPATWLEAQRRDAGDLLTRVLPEPEAGLAAGILIGLRDRVDRTVAADFTTAGVSHVVAISGWNIAIVAAAIGSVAGRLGRRRRSLITVVAIVAYIAFAGASPSVLRAGAMAGVVLLARESGRTGRAAAALGWAAFLLLLADPKLVLDAGFQLSSLATAGLIAWGTSITDRLQAAGRGRVPRWLAESLGVSLAAQAATLPVVLAAFGRLALISPVVNLLIVPIVAPAMAAGLLAMAGGALVAMGAPPALGAILAAPGWVMLRIIIGIVELSAGVPGASIAFDPAAGTALALGLVLIGGLVLARRRSGPPGVARAPSDRSAVRGGGPPRDPGSDGATGPSTAGGAGRSTGILPSRALRLATGGLIVAIVVTGGVVASRPTGSARVTVLDVGQGDAILVEGSAGGRLLVDGGPDPDRLLVALDRRLPPWDRRIDVLVLSHPHEDHVAGLAMLLSRYRIGRVLEPGMRGPGPGYAAWSETLAGDQAVPRGTIAAGDRIAVDEVRLDVLWPIAGRVPVDPPDGGTGINNVSVVLLGAVGSRRFLLAGDVEEAIDRDLLATDLPRLDLLKIAHHGSRTATTEAFVASVRPRVAVASAGAGNPYGHPARATMDRLGAAGARVYRTDRDGTVSISFGGGGMAVRTEGPRSAAGWAPRGTGRATAATDGGPRRAFGCGIPSLAPARDAAPATPTRAVATGARRPPHGPGPAERLGYHRVDDRARARGSRCPALLPGSTALVPGTRARRRRDRGLPGRPYRERGYRRGPWSGRGGRAVARRGQTDPGRRSGPDPPARDRIGALARRARPP